MQHIHRRDVEPLLLLVALFGVILLLAVLLGTSSPVR